MIEGCIKLILQRHHNIAEPTFAQIKDYYDTHLHPDVLDLGDQNVYESIFHKGQWIGIFQFAEQGAQKFAQRAKPRSIIDLSARSLLFGAPIVTLCSVDSFSFTG